MKKAITQKVSDIHFIPAGTETHIKFRVKGDLVDYDIIQRQITHIYEILSWIRCIYT